MFVEIFNDLLQECGLNRKQFAEQSGIPYTTVVGWTKLNRLPDYGALIKIADFFRCSIDYLTGREDEYGRLHQVDDIFAEERKLLRNFRAMSAEDKDLLLKLSYKMLK